jgi:granule-bound starch synthase
MCIHNLAYQGTFPASIFPRLCLPNDALAALSSSSDWQRVLEDLNTGSSNNATLLEDESLGVPCLCPPTEPCTCPEDSEPSSSLATSLLPSSSSSSSSNPSDNLKSSQQLVVGDLNFMRAGLLAADEIITVSPTYAEEIQNQPEMGCGLQDILTTRGVTGIMNGIDTEEWDPATDPLLPEEGRYGIKNMVAGKTVMKQRLQRRLGLEENADAALVVFIGRLTEQKGLDVLLGAVPAVLGGSPAPAPIRYQQPPSRLDEEKKLEKERRDNNRLQVAMLGTGEAWIQAALTGLELSFPGQAVGVTAFSEELAHWLLAAADYVIVPSRFEPCGLVAQCGVRYGAVPLVAAVGGLKDLVQPGIGYTLSPLSPPGDALSRRADVDGLAELLRRVEIEAGTYSHRSMQRNCMEAELSWAKPAAEWETAISRLSKKHSNSAVDQ